MAGGRECCSSEWSLLLSTMKPNTKKYDLMSTFTYSLGNTLNTTYRLNSTTEPISGNSRASLVCMVSVTLELS